MPNIHESFPSNYLKASDLRGRSVVVKIDRVGFEPVGQTKEMKPILYFVGKDKGVVLNKTNANKIIGLVGSPNTEDWAGFHIMLYPTETSFQGETVDCIRVKPAPAAAAGKRLAVPEPEPEPEPPPLDDSDIPFMWLLPLVLPALATMGMLA